MLSRCIQLLYVCSCKTMRAIIVLSAPSSFLHVMLIEQASKILMFRDVSFNKQRRQLKLKQNLKTSKRLTSFVLAWPLLFLYDYRMSQVFHLRIMVHSQLIQFEDNVISKYSKISFSFDEELNEKIGTIGCVYERKLLYHKNCTTILMEFGMHL